MNETANNSCIIAYKYANYIILPTGILLNLICIIIFTEIIKSESPNQQQCNLFRYLLLKSIYDCLYPILLLPEFNYFRADEVSSVSTFKMQLWNLYSKKFLTHICTTLSLFLEICASFDCLLMITQYLRKLRSRFCFKLSVVLSFVCFILYYLPIFLSYKIVVAVHEHRHSNDTVLYRCDFTGNKYLKVYKDLDIVLRDLVSISFLVGLNLLILIAIKQTSERKKRIQGQHFDGANSLSHRAEMNKVKMILFTSSIYLLHLPNLIGNFIDENYCNNLIFKISIRLSYAISFFSYLFFNKNFKKVFFKLFVDKLLGNSFSNRVHSSN
jgi:hypothetical protein